MASRQELNLTNARDISLNLLLRVQVSDSYVNLLLPKELAKHQINDADRGLVQELTYGCLRWELQYDRMIDHFTPGKVLSPHVRTSIRLGLHQLFRMRVPAHAAINESVDLVKKYEPNAAGLANAVLRNAERAGFDSLVSTLTNGLNTIEALSVKYSHPTWIVSGFLSALDLDGRKQELEQFLASNNEVPQVNLAGLSDASRLALDELGSEHGSASPIGYLAEGSLDKYLEIPGVRVQDQGSQLVALALGQVANLEGTWLDMCAGPGGKAAVLESLKPISKGELVCYEPNQKRAELVSNALDKVHQSKVEVRSGQSAPADSFDAILLDAPCSGLGSLRRKPEARWRKSPEQLPELTTLQSSLIDSAVKALKSGGYLMYATCSPLVAETNTQIRGLIERHPNMKLVDLPAILGRLNPELKLNTSRKTVQLWTHQHRTDAMFMALLKKD